MPDRRSHLALKDLTAEALTGLLQRPARSLLTMLGTVIGTASLVAILGFTATSAGQISARFSVLGATEVTVEDAAARTRTTDPVLSFPADADARVEALNGVVAAGRYWKVPLPQGTSVSARALPTPRDTRPLDVYAASPGALRAAHASVVTGTLLDPFHERGEQVALLGSAAAAQLGITRLDAQPAVFVGNQAYTVIGIVGTPERLPQLALGVVIPTETAKARYGLPSPDDPARMLVETALGSAPLIASQLPLALRPDNPSALSATAPPDPRSLRDSVTGDVDSLLVLLAGLSLVIGAVGIANTTLVSVMERRPEIGLRRALGARRHHIAAQFIRRVRGAGPGGRSGGGEPGRAHGAGGGTDQGLDGRPATRGGLPGPADRRRCRVARGRLPGPARGLHRAGDRAAGLTAPPRGHQGRSR
ncbi:ABC transporter permease [Actinokineospora pegani]|uniref:ABC transporter permease n=1 Tax=Actinokineospora pegani TaxID=2654637 RepID=UPI0018D34AD3|nr:ABC transporter permease [Actinokineospora pegani]